jgi:acetyl-CoA C-acetyltransferase
MAEAYIVEALRSAGGRRNGKLAGMHPADLGAEVLNALVDKTGIDPAAIDDVIVGCVTQAGEQTYAFARNVIIASKLPLSVPGVTIDRQCGSSQQAISFAAMAVMSGVQDMIIAGGVENMSRVPMSTNYTLHAEKGMGVGPVSPRIHDRLGITMYSQFEGAQKIAEKYGFDRLALDTYALESHKRAAAATNAGAFKREIVPITVDTKEGRVVHDKDEGIRYDATIESIGSVKLLAEGGVLSAANASQVCDGASAVLIVNEKALKEHKLTPIARIHNMTVTAGDPVIMLEEPIPATATALKKAGMKLSDIDLFEINEAFASIPLAWLKATGADPAKTNVNGGAIALGHPLGATGAKLMATLVHSLRAQKKRWGFQAMCEGGGTANVTIVEAL